MRKARLLYLTDKYEEELISITGKHKEDYIGQIGKICKVQHLYDKTTHWIDLFDIEFDETAEDLYYLVKQGIVEEYTRNGVTLFRKKTINTQKKSGGGGTSYRLTK